MSAWTWAQCLLLVCVICVPLFMWSPPRRRNKRVNLPPPSPLCQRVAPNNDIPTRSIP